MTSILAWPQDQHVMHVCENRDGWQVTWGLRACMRIRFSTVHSIINSLEYTHESPTRQAIQRYCCTNTTTLQRLFSRRLSSRATSRHPKRNCGAEEC